MTADISNDLGNFTMIPVDVLRDSGINRNSKMLYAFLWDYAARNTNMSHPSRKTLATDMGSSLDTIDRAIAELRSAGILEVVARYTDAGDRTSNGYRLIFRQGGRKSGVTPPTSPAATVAAGEVEEQEPLKPEPVEPEKPRKARTALPKAFAVTEEMRAWAAVNTPAVDVDKKLGEWVDYWTGVGRPMKDWVAVWRNGMRKQQEFAVRDGWKPADNVTSLRDVTEERMRAQKQAWLHEHGITEAEFEAHKHDEAWLRSVTGGDSA